MNNPGFNRKLPYFHFKIDIAIDNRKLTR